VTARGTHVGEFMGIAPTGKPVSFNAVDVVRISGGKIVERWSQADNLALLQQLGAVPAPGRRPPRRSHGSVQRIFAGKVWSGPASLVSVREMGRRV
jgi:SnoaL-like polyketide cyclase